MSLGLERLATTLFAIDEREHADDRAAAGAHGVDRAKRRTAGRDRVFDHDDASPAV